MEPMENRSGMQPVEFKVLIKPDPVEEKTRGGIIIPDDPREQEAAAQVKGVLVASGDSAFGDWSVTERTALRPGTRVYFAKYQGIVVYGADGEEYRLVQDKDVSAIIHSDAAGATKLRGRKKGALSAA